MSAILPPSALTVPFYSSAEVMTAVAQFDAPQIISDAYTTLYDGTKPPTKCILPYESDDHFTMIMPYEDKPKGIVMEKVVFVDRLTRPGVKACITIYDSKTGRPIASMDATALTGLRTAAKSVLFAKMYFSRRVGSNPRTIHIYGSSTQAYFHVLQFLSAFPSLRIRVIARSAESGEALGRRLMDNAVQNCEIVTAPPAGETPDVIITATSSPSLLVTQDNAMGVPLIIAAGSSSGRHSEIDPRIVASRSRFIDSRVSIDGKGEYKIPIERCLIERDSITELYDVLVAGASYVFDSRNTALFVSKGLVIEDYMFVAKILGLR